MGFLGRKGNRQGDVTIEQAKNEDVGTLFSLRHGTTFWEQTTGKDESRYD